MPHSRLAGLFRLLVVLTMLGALPGTLFASPPNRSSESALIVRDEITRLDALEQKVMDVTVSLQKEKAALDAQRVSLVGWEARLRTVARSSDPAETDMTYDELLTALHNAAHQLGDVLAKLEGHVSAVPSIGADPLDGLPASADMAAAASKRMALISEMTGVRKREEAFRKKQAAFLIDEISKLAQGRLELLPSLSTDKLDAINGFTESGWEQAHTEINQLTLVARYQLLASRNWVGSLGNGSGKTWWLVVALVPWILYIAAFIWLRKQTPALINEIEHRLAETDHAEGFSYISPQRQAWIVFAGMHRSVEWLLFLAVINWLIPLNMQQWIEIKLVLSIAAWVIGGSLVIHAINAIAHIATPVDFIVADIDRGSLRLKSLRLVGQVVIGMILVRVVTERLVGEGTIYHWVSSVSWLAVIPVFLFLVSWWRETIFKRVDWIRNKSVFEQWVVHNRLGWKSFLAATIGGATLFTRGFLKHGRRSISQVGAARRAHAYIFRREVERLAQEQTTQLHPLPEHVSELFSPTLPQKTWVHCPVDVHVDHLSRRASDRLGGVIAIIGPRGMGKTTLLRKLEGIVSGSAYCSCSASTDVTTLKEIGPAPLILMDDTQLLYRPILGGMKIFDSIHAHARSNSRTSLWIFAIDAIAWPFLRRARDQQPLFDEVIQLDPWREKEIAELLLARSRQADVQPSFGGLLGNIPPSFDEFDKAQALHARQVGYFRMIWDHAGGNPGIALEAWRTSLAAENDGAVQVKSLHAPEIESIEKLSDPSLFILRAVLQMEPAKKEDIMAATRLSISEIQSSLEYGYVHGFLFEQDGLITVTWPWLRAVVNLLERRHMLVSP